MIGGAKGIGLGIDLGLVNQYNRTGSQSYIEPEVLDSLVGVWSAYGMTNDSPNRSTIKNKLSNKGGDFVISNAAFKLNSGFGKYEEDFTSWIQTNGVIASSDKVQNSIVGRFLYFNTVNKKEDVPSFKVNITLGQQSKLQYNYIKEDGTSTYIVYSESGIYTIPASYFSKYTGGNAWFGFYQIEGTSIIEQIPSFEGAFVTDGIDDLITSTKTVQEMLGGSNEITVVSMVHQIDGTVKYTNGYTNYICHGGGFIRNTIAGINGKGFNKTGIYGYTSTNLNSSSSNLGNIVNNILGDKDDYSFERSSTYTLDDAKYSVQNFVNANNQPSNEGSSVAWYWTIIANKVLTTDQINQVIAYFNLDRTLKSDIYCNIAKQGITNENHAEFGDKLIDFSGNGRDIQLNNIAWKGDSGIGKYETELSNTSIWAQSKETTSSPFSSSYNGLSGWIIFANTELTNSVDMPSFKIQVKGLLEGQELIYRYYDSNGQSNVYSITKDGDYTLPSDFRTAKPQISNTSGFQVVKNEANIITITQIPSHAGALCLDGVNDFGQFVGDLGLKDYTFIMDREYLSLKADQVPVISSINPLTDTPFIFEHCVYENRVARPFSFGKDTVFEEQLASKRFISYQSTYKYNGKDIARGTFVNTGSGLTIGRYGDDKQYANFVLYFLMLFPYSMSEFLIERQLKKHKLGTLYPDMVEFRPIIKHDDRITAIKYYHIKGSSWINLKPGDYIPVGSKISITTNLKSPYTIANVMSSSLTDIKVVPSAEGGNAYDILGYVTDKSPQKITMDIQVDSSLVQWNPVVESNVPYKSVKYYKLVDTSWKAINVGDYVLVGQRILTQITTVGIEDEVVAAVSEQLDIYGINKKPNGEYNILGITSSTTPQNINITIDEYIRYEDIVQPYPILLRFNDENGNEVSWGGKFRVGSTITRIGSIADPENNLLNGLYSVSGLSLNGKAVTSNTSIVEKQMVFKTTATYLLDNNEPKVILSPRLLRIPNSSYKLLGYIPDISGHGNHGVIHNSAYEEESGANGRVDCSFSISNSLVGNRIIFSDDGYKMSFTDDRALDIHAYPGQATIGGGKARVTGMKSGSYIRFYTYPEFTVITEDGIYDIPYIDADSTDRDVMYFSNCKGVTIEGIGEYEGAYCLDGVDDHITIPTLSSGGKQVLMKVNWQNDYDAPGYMYDSNTGEYRNYIIKGNKEQIAYENASKTYIDGILNANLTSGDLKDITHNITSQFNNASGIPYIGCRYSLENFLKMSLYDFMLFDNISTGDKIKELNEYVGIEAKVELPPYYWDAYGKTNLDEDKNYIANLGTVKDVIETGYPYTFADADAWWGSDAHYTVIDDYTARLTPSSSGGSSELYFGYRGNIPLKVKITSTETYSLLYHASEDIRFNVIANEPLITELPYGTFEIIGLGNDSYITIELLPTEINTRYGLSNKNFAYDKMSGYGGYEFAKFDNTSEWISTNNSDTIEVVNRDGYDVVLRKVGNGTNYWHFRNTIIKSLGQDIQIGVYANKSVQIVWQLKYKLEGETDYNTLAIASPTIEGNINTYVTLPYKTEQEIADLNAVDTYYSIYFIPIDLDINEEVTIEMLPLYPNGLVYDGITDYSENANIPAFTDFTYIFKRELLDASANTCSMYKGILTEGSKTAFVSDYDKNTEIGGYSFGNYVAVSSLRTNKIIYGTKASVNGDNIVPGNNVDALGLVLGKYYDSSYKKMVFYKLILYPKTIPLLQINFLKNLMERDEIIDLNNKIFIQE